jgi:hypothetical protein
MYFKCRTAYDQAKRSAWFPAGLMLDLQDLLGRLVDVATLNQFIFCHNVRSTVTSHQLI